MATVGKPKGSPKTGGRKKGTKNKKSQAVQDKLDEMNCDPIEGMAKIANDAIAVGDVKLAFDAYKELAQYVTPKLKSIEHTGANGDAIEHKVTKVEFTGV